MSGLHFRQGDDWKPVKTVYVKQAGVWRKVRRVHVKQAGSWRVSYGGIFSFGVSLTGKYLNYNLADELRKAGWNGKSPVMARVTLAYGAVVGSSSTSRVSFDMGVALPESSVFTLVISSGAYLVGAGGAGAYTPAQTVAQHGGATTGNMSGDGGDALRVLSPVSIINDGIIGGGGGGGITGYPPKLDRTKAGPPGGGGAGYLPGTGGNRGGLTKGGLGALWPGKSPYGKVWRGRRGSNLGEVPFWGTFFGVRGKPGKAVIGNRFVKWRKQGDIRGKMV